MLQECPAAGMGSSGALQDQHTPPAQNPPEAEAPVAGGAQVGFSALLWKLWCASESLSLEEV